MTLLSLFPLAWILFCLTIWGTDATDADPSAQADPSVPLRQRMVAEQIAGRDVRDPAVLKVMREVPRHLFVPPGQVNDAYEDTPLPIGHGQTISQPYIVALMTELVRPRASDRVLEIGTGCGYQAAVLSRLVQRVFTMEIVDALAETARERLARLGYSNVQVRAGDGYRGWPEEAPFEIIVVTAAPEDVPQALVDQLAPRGRLVIPVGGRFSQNLELIEKDAAGRIHRRVVAPVRFVPMVKK